MSTTVSVDSTPGLSASHLAALRKRGLTDGTIMVARLRSATAEQIKNIFGFSPSPGPEALQIGLTGSPGIAIPFLDPHDPSKIRLTRFRLDFPALIGGKEAKYIGPKGAGNLLYFPPSIADGLQDRSIPLIVTEGEFKTLAAHQAGLHCVGSVGVWGWRGKNQNGASQPIPDLDLIVWKSRVVTIVFDSDAATNPLIQKARHELGKELYRRGASGVYGINLPSRDGTKVGLDDFLLKNGLETFHDLDVFELPRTDIAPFSHPVSEFLQGEPEPLEWGIIGLQPVGASGFRIAGPKTGKSWLMLEEAYCLSTAQPVFGHFQVPRRRRVLILEEEDNRRRLIRRLKRVIHAHGGAWPDDAYLRISVKAGLRIDDPKWREVLEWEISNFRPEFCYLDVFNRLHSKDINDASEMTEIILFLDRLAREYQVTFIILHHTRKMTGMGDSHDEIIGSRVLGGFTEATMFLSPTKEKGVLRVKVSLKDEPEDGTFEQEFQIKLTDTQDGLGTHFEYLGAPPEKQASLELREKIKNFVLSQDHPVRIKDVSAGVGVSKNTVRDHLDSLTDLKILDRVKDGQALTYSPITPLNLKKGMDQ